MEPSRCHPPFGSQPPMKSGWGPVRVTVKIILVVPESPSIIDTSLIDTVGRLCADIVEPALPARERPSIRYGSPLRAVNNISAVESIILLTIATSRCSRLKGPAFAEEKSETAKLRAQPARAPGQIARSLRGASEAELIRERALGITHLQGDLLAWRYLLTRPTAH